jgi:hypothetical protein
MNLQEAKNIIGTFADEYAKCSLERKRVLNREVATFIETSKMPDNYKEALYIYYQVRRGGK